ncbi:HAD family hydrolase [Legionella yabuuchiae]|uniref:HAD family hydrolase n=1 Tax=Legionella yabuuchiae TaxID=376727 RepID=UPI001056ADFA|nr:HAD family phosphatase [Legionella yabuuchiae]
MLEAVIFDFDGVILDSEPLHYEACCMSLKTLGLSITYSEYMADYLGLSDKEMFPQLLMSQGHYLSPKEINSLIDKKIESYAYLINSRNKLPFIPGVEQFITNLHQKSIKIAICTGSTKTELLPVLERFKSGNLTHYFDVIVTSEEVQYGKPSPEGYLLTINRLGVSPKHCQAFEDSPYGIDAAKKAGLKVTALATTHNKHELNGADNVISNFEELLTAQSMHKAETA